MLFRTNKGILVEIKKYDFPNDKLYYEKLMEIKKPISKEHTILSKSIEYFIKKNIINNTIQQNTIQQNTIQQNTI